MLIFFEVFDGHTEMFEPAMVVVHFEEFSDVVHLRGLYVEFSLAFYE